MKELVHLETCPLCSTHKIGRIGRERFFCAECCHEWTGTVDITIYKILADGTTIGLVNGEEILSNKMDECLSRRVG